MSFLFHWGLLLHLHHYMLLNAFWGLKMVFTPKGAHTFSSFSLTPLTYGRNIGLAVSLSVSFSLDLGAEEKALLTVLTGYPLSMDYLTKGPEVFAVPDQMALIIARLIVSSQLLSDRGPAFLSNLVQELCVVMGTKKVNHRISSPDRRVGQMIQPYSDQHAGEDHR